MIVRNARYESIHPSQDDGVIMGIRLEKSAEKIDGAVTAIMAPDRAVRNGGSTGSVYDERGF